LYLLLCYSVSYQYIYCCPSSTHYNNSGVLYQFVVPCAPGVHAQQCLPLRRFSAQPPINALFASTPLLHLILFCTRTCWHYHKCVICSILIFCSSKSVQNSLYNAASHCNTFQIHFLSWFSLFHLSPCRSYCSTADEMIHYCPLDIITDSIFGISPFWPPAASELPILSKSSWH